MSLRIGWIVAGLIAAAGGAGGVSAPACAQDQASAGAAIESVDQLLDALERADADIRTFHSELIYDRQFVLQEDRHIRYGSLSFLVEPPTAPGRRAQRTFAVRFETLMMADDAGFVRHEDESLWVFDGQWLIEKREAEKQFIKRQIARPNDPIDPLRLGEGPLPIPIGQKKLDILARYDAELLPADAGIVISEGNELAAQEAREFQAFVKSAYQLRLVPKADRREEDDFREIRLWYAHGTLLPRAARTINRAGDVVLVLLAGAAVNQPLARDVLNVEEPAPGTGWHVQIDEGRFSDRAAQDDGNGAER